MRDETRNEEERLREHLAQAGYSDWRPPAGFGSAVLLRARSRVSRPGRKGLALMRRRSVRFAAVAVGVCVLGLVTVGATTGFASVVEAGKRWFNLGGEGANVYVRADEPTGEVQGKAVVVTYDSATGERTVQEMDIAPTMLDAYAPLEKMEAGIAEGKYQVEKTRGTLADMDELCPPPNLEMPSGIELPDGVELPDDVRVSAGCGAVAIAGGPGEALDPNQVVDIFRFTDTDGNLVALCAADPETGEVVQFRSAESEIRLTTTATIDGSGEGACDGPQRRIVMSRQATAGGCGEVDPSTCIIASTVRVRVNDDGTITVTVDGEDIDVSSDASGSEGDSGEEAAPPADDPETEQASL